MNTKKIAHYFIWKGIPILVCLLIIISSVSSLTISDSYDVTMAKDINHLDSSSLKREYNFNNIAEFKQLEKPGTFSDYRKGREHTPFVVTKQYESKEMRDLPMIIIFVKTNLFSALTDDINLYTSTLESQGYSVVALEVSGGTAEDLKAELVSYWNAGSNLVGAVLIGDLPAAWYHHDNDYGGYPEEFPCDLYLMDLDGLWLDTNNDGLYDSHTVGSGDEAPEIYIGRIDASKVPGDEIGIIRQYLQKVHAFWIGDSPNTEQGLTYTDEDWMNNNDIKTSIHFAYPTYTKICYPQANRDDYVNNRLPGTYAFIQLACHSDSSSHFFANGGLALSNEIRAAPPMALFYNLFSCSALRFTSNNCLGDAYILNTSSPSLAVIGSTKTGSMLGFSIFYQYIGQFYSFGKAFQNWFDYWDPYSNDDITWWYGMTILGDPTLIPNMFNAHVQIPSVGIIHTPIQFSASAWGGVKPYTWTWEFGDGSLSHTQNPNHTYNATDKYIVTMTVTDSSGKSVIQSAPLTIKILDADTHGPYQQIIYKPIQFTGSVQGGHSPYTWYWDFGDGTNTTEQNPIHNYTSVGKHVAVLTVTDSDDQSDSENTTVDIAYEPTANAHGPYLDVAGRPIDFTGSASNGFPPYTWQWEFGDGNISNLQYPTHIYDSEGNYSVLLTVTDSKGNSATDATMATLSPRPDTVWVDDNYNESTSGWDYDHFNMIQTGIDRVTNDGSGLVYVFKGNYPENILIDKPLMLQGENTTQTRINPSYIDNVVTITADHVTVSGFKISIYWYGNSYVAGIRITSNNNTITGNLIMNNYAGINLSGSSYNMIADNTFEFNGIGGIYLKDSDNNIITRNFFTTNEYDGIYIDRSSNNQILENKIELSCYYGIELNDHSENNMIRENTITDNWYGIYAHHLSNNNHIVHNTFISSSPVDFFNALDECTNFWDNGYPSGGNFWSDHPGNDQYQGVSQNIPGSDGIIDITYMISGGSNQDHYPLVHQYVLGDMNVDGVVDFGDINPFVKALTNPAAYQNQYLMLPAIHGDINRDGICDFGDINPFVVLLSGD